MQNDEIDRELFKKIREEISPICDSHFEGSTNPYIVNYMAKVIYFSQHVSPEEFYDSMAKDEVRKLECLAIESLLVAAEIPDIDKETKAKTIDETSDYFLKLGDRIDDEDDKMLYHTLTGITDILCRILEEYNERKIYSKDKQYEEKHSLREYYTALLKLRDLNINSPHYVLKKEVLETEIRELGKKYGRENTENTIKHLNSEACAKRYFS